jgi:CTP synthase (UTP-ammonia lyase)
MLLEHVRNVLGFRDADHEETSPDASTLAVTALSCSLVGQAHEVHLLAGSRARSIYGRATSTEDYFCSYGLNRSFESQLEASGLHVAAHDRNGEPRLVERRDHPFFVGTLFMPQTRSSQKAPHPLLAAFCGAVEAPRREPDDGHKRT